MYRAALQKLLVPKDPHDDSNITPSDTVSVIAARAKIPFLRRAHRKRAPRIMPDLPDRKLFQRLLGTRNDEPTMLDDKFNKKAICPSGSAAGTKNGPYSLPAAIAQF